MGTNTGTQIGQAEIDAMKSSGARGEEARAGGDTAAAANTGNYAIDRSGNVRSGRLGVELNAQGVPKNITYYTDDGTKLRSTIFNAAEFLKTAQKYGIDVRDALGLEAGLDAQGIGFRPYELYKGTGSDHGVSFSDLVGGGYGTAYNWTSDPNAALKGPGAAQRVAENERLATNLGLERSGLTSSLGVPPVDTSRAQQLQSDTTGLRSYAATNDSGAMAWFDTPDKAQQYAQQTGGQTVDLSNRGVVNMDNPNQLTLGADRAGVQAQEAVGTYDRPTFQHHNFQASPQSTYTPGQYQAAAQAQRMQGRGFSPQQINSMVGGLSGDTMRYSPNTGAAKLTNPQMGTPAGAANFYDLLSRYGMSNPMAIIKGVAGRG